MEHTVICLSRQSGSGGREVGRRLAKRLNIPFYDYELIELAAEKGGIQLERLEKVDERKTNPWLYRSLYEGNGSVVTRGGSPNDTLFWLQSEVVREKAKEGSCIFVGRCAGYILRKAGIPHHSVFICAPWEDRIRRAGMREQLDEKSAAAYVSKVDKQRKGYTEYYTGESWGKPEDYELCVNSSVLGLDGTAELLARLVRAAEDEGIEGK